MASTATIQEILDRLHGQVLRTRFAPSPTGYLHLGHVVNALFVWGIARACKGEVVLRLENHDRIRCKPEYETALLQDLEWLGFEPDLGKPAEFRAGACTYRQSDCELRYQKALQTLQEKQLVYVCDCSRKSILARTEQIDAEELRYDGHCRDRGLVDGPGKTLRIRIPDRLVEFDDVLLGKQTHHPASQIGDFAIRDNHGHWTYQFAVVVDDLAQAINMVIRGMDILSSTGRQILLGEMLGQIHLPIYLHHPLLVDENGQKLSKRDFSKDIHQRNMSGESAKSVLTEARTLGGESLILLGSD
jgi:glutamyl-Q tRNA(Asp) synthetase